MTRPLSLYNAILFDQLHHLGEQQINAKKSNASYFMKRGWYLFFILSFLECSTNDFWADIYTVRQVWQCDNRGIHHTSLMSLS